jgi:hypothetical protein
MRRRPRRLLIPALLTGLGAATALAPPRVAGQEVVEPPVYRSSKPYASDVEADNPPRPAFGVDGGLDYRDQYFFRGYNRASSGVVLQPYFDLKYTLVKEGDFSVTPHAGAFFSLTEQKGPENPQHWNEFRANTGVAVEWEGLVFDFQWQLITSPSELFQRSEEIGVEVRYDDHRLWGRNSPIAALNPKLSFFHEYYDQNDSEGDAYVGLRLEPELHTFDVGPVPVTLSFPLEVGGSYNGYYFTDEGKVDQVGYWVAGIKAAVDLPVSRKWQTCRLEAEVDYIRLMADSVERANGGDGDDVTLRFGIMFDL